MDIVGAAVQEQIGHGRLASERVSVHVVELQEGAFAAAAAALPDERTLTAVPQPNGALDVGRDVARPAAGAGLGRGLDVAASFFLAMSSSSSFSARSKITPGSPLGISRRSRS